MVDGGGELAGLCLAQVQQVAAGVGDALDGLAQLRAAVAPLAAEHVPGEALAVWPHQRRAKLAEVRQIGDVVLLRYALSPRFEDE